MAAKKGTRKRSKIGKKRVTRRAAPRRSAMDALPPGIAKKLQANPKAYVKLRKALLAARADKMQDVLDKFATSDSQVRALMPSTNPTASCATNSLTGMAKDSE